MDAMRFDLLTRKLGSRTTRRTAVGSALAALALGGLDRLAAAQDETPAPDATPVAEDDAPVFMFLQTAASGRGEANPGAGTPVVAGTPAPAGGASFLLTLEGHTGQTIYFSDRPAREVGAVPTADFLEGLGFSAENPPNAALVAEFERGQGVVVLELIQPAWDAETGTLVYGAEVLEGYQGENLTPVLAEQVAARLPTTFGPAALFIDSCWDLTVCWCWHSSLRNYEMLGEIPVGHISTRWSLLAPGCIVMEDEWNAAVDSCRSAYSCGYYNDEPIELGRSSGPYDGWICESLASCR
jgi:hypothetical protein